MGISINNINPVILIGGSGTRLWPLSRVNYPKQFIKFSGAYSLFQLTLLRLNNIENINQIYLVVGENNYFLCLEQLRELNLKNIEMLIEPVGRNTAPAIAVAAEAIKKKSGDAQLMLVLPSDHQIKDTEKFAESINQAVEFAKDKIILFGIKPIEPSTAYGYIQTENKINNKTGNKTIPLKVEKFLEKPDLEKAKILISKQNCFWNSGMFFFSVDVIVNAIEKHAPEINELAKNSLDKAIKEGCATYLNKTIFSKMPNIAIDIAVMEKTDNAFVFKLKSDWSDLGDWNSVSKNEAYDINGNVNIGNILTINTKNSYLNSPNKLLATIGVDNLVVVTTRDSVLVANKNQTQDVKTLVNLLKNSNFSECIENDLKVFRPWGSYENVVDLDNFKVKHIIVKPGGKLSLQMHHQRSEHWIVVKGIADVVCGEKNYEVYKNESTYIPKKTKHRLMNLQETPLHLIEVQVGDYLKEDDIIRFDDIYGRSAYEKIT